MATTERTVLHVLPHPGGGGERYVDLLSEMEGYRFRRVFLGSSATMGARELLRAMVAVVRQAHGFDLLHVHGEAAAGLCLPLIAAEASVVTLHGLHLVRRLTGWKRQVAVLNLRAVLRAARCTICVARTEYEELARIVGPKAARHAVVIRNGVHVPPPATPAQRAAVRHELGVADDEVVAIWVGSLDARKDPLTVVSAANETGIALIVVGDGPLRQEVAQAAGPKVFVLGQRNDVQRFLGAADIFITSSKREGLSLSLLEAMASGLVPVAADIPENGEAVGTAGVLIPCGDEKALADALRRLSADTTARRLLAAAAHARAASFFTARAMVGETHDLYNDVFQSRSLEGGRMVRARALF